MVAADAAPDARPEIPVELPVAAQGAQHAGHEAPLTVPPGCSLTVDMLVQGRTAAAAVPAAPSAEPPATRTQNKAGAPSPSSSENG